MARPERPVDPQAGPVQRLAHELRELRRGAGGPSYRTMAQSGGFSSTTLSQAAAGERLPSLEVLKGYVRACGGDPGAWEPRWKEAQAAAEADEPATGDGGPSPYRGLARFEPDDHALFFGRDRMAEELKKLVCDHRFAVLFGASGSGKSSLLRAGLIPRLREEIARLRRPAVLRVITPGARPVEAYGHLLAPAEDEPESWMVVDQFEELFTLCRDRAERARFVDLLLAAREPGSRLRVLIVVRADFYARCAEHRGLADALRGAGLLVGPMTAEELREAVVGPAQAAGLVVERTLTAHLVAEVLDEPGGLPMLSHVLLETWRRRRGRVLTLAGYEAAGGVRGAIAASAETVYADLSPEQARTARQLLLRMVEPGQGTPDTRRPLTRAELTQWADPAVEAVVERLARARLLTADEEGVQLAHEALITCWPRLHGWIDENRDWLRHRRRLTESAHAWLEHDRDPGGLYRGIRLDLARELLAEPERSGELTAPEREFLFAALDAREAERRAAARSTRRSRILLGAFSGVLAVAMLVGVVGYQQHRDNQRRRTDDAARRVAEVANALRTSDPRAALLLGVAAWRTAQLPETRRALLGSLAQPETDAFTDPAPGDSVHRFLTADGRTLLSAGDGTWRTWNVAAHHRTAAGRLPAGSVSAASPDGRILAVTGTDGTRLWNRTTGHWTGARSPLPLTDTVTFTADSRSYLVSEVYTDRVRLLSITDGRPLYETRATGEVGVASSADAGRAAVCPSGDGSPQVRDIGSGRLLPGAWTGSHGSCAADTGLLVYGAGSGGRFAAVTGSGVRVWDTGTGRTVAELADAGVQYAAFSRDGAFLATSDAQEIRVWRLASPTTPVFRHSLDNQHLYGGLAWDPARPLLRYLEGATAHTLDLGTAVTSTWRQHALDDVRFSPDGRTYATAQRTTGTHYVFQLRATADGHLLRTLPAPPLPVSGDPTTPVIPKDTLALMAFSPDSTAFGYGVSAPGREAAPQRFTLWDLAGNRRRTTLDLATPASATPVISVALGPAGHTLYAARTTSVGDLSDEVWDTGRGRRTAVLPGMASSHLAVRPDGGLLVGDGRIVRPPSDRSTARDLVQGDEVGALAFSADGTVLAAGDQSGRVALWDGDAGRRAGVLRNVFPAPLGDTDTPEAVSALAVSPDGSTLAVGGDAGSVQLWDLATRQPLGGPLTTPGDPVDSLSFAADGSTLYVGGAHVPLQRYAVDAGRAVTAVCARVGKGSGGLSEAQWRTYVPDAPACRPAC